MVRELDFVDECYKDKDLSLLKKLTLVIPTYNRNYYLSRCLWYHAHFPFGQIIVADSSPEEKKVVNRETVAKIREMFGANVLYLEYQPETEKYGGDIPRKWGDAVQHVETEYSQICLDKGFTFPNTLVKGISYLDKHLDYIVLSGEYYDYSENRGSELTIRYQNRCSSLDNDALIRYNASLNGGWNNSLLYSLYRTPYHQKCYEPILSKRLTDLRFGERHIAFVGYMFGKMKQLEQNMHIVRDVSQLNINNQVNTAESSTLRYPSLKEYDKKSDMYCQNYNNIRDEIINQLVKYADKPKVEIAEFVNSKIMPKIKAYEFGITNLSLSIINKCVSLSDKYKLINTARSMYRKYKLNHAMSMNKYMTPSQYTSEIKCTIACIKSTIPEKLYHISRGE